MQQLIEDCKAGKIDLILTKSIARFARNIVDCLSVIETLKNLDPPVGVKFEADNIYTLDSNGRMILTILVSFQIQDALPIENGRVLDKTGSPTFALCREESSSAQNNPTSEEKADSGAV